MPRYQRHVFICTNSRPPESSTGCCASKGGDEVRTAFKDELRRRKLASIVRANKSGCLANCDRGVTVVVYPEGVWYGGVKPEDVSEIIERHILRGELVERLLVEECWTGPLRLSPLEIPESASGLGGRPAAGERG